MAHELEITQGAARMAFAGDVPWHRLGTKMNGLQTADDMLTAAKANFIVKTRKVIACDEDGQPLYNIVVGPNGPTQEFVYVDDSRATVREDVDGTYAALSTVGTRYEVAQNADVMQRALNIIAATDDEAVVETVGVTHGGKRFFSAIDLGSLVIDPLNAHDLIGRYLLVTNSHDGKTPVCYANTNIRAVCANTVRLGLSTASATFKARHTKNGNEFANEEARRALKFSLEWAEALGKMATTMMQIEIPVGSQRVDKVLNALWTPQTDETDRQRDNREEIHGKVRALFVSPKNVGKVGANGWALYNAVTEYADHGRGGTADDRALTSMDDVSIWSKLKIEAQHAVLALV